MTRSQDTDHVATRTTFSFKGILRIEADVCYKKDCPFEGSSDWVGASSLADDIVLKLDDVTEKVSYLRSGTNPFMPTVPYKGHCEIA